MVFLQISEPGSYPVNIDLARRLGPGHTVVIGVARGEPPKNHIAFRKGNGFLSRRQVTIMAVNGDLNKLLIRDGGKGDNELWSPKWKHTFINSVPLSHTDWRPFNLGDIVRFHPEKPMLSGYSLKIAFDSTDGTLSDAQTMSFDVIRVWESKSLATRGAGVLLLMVPHNDGSAIIQRLDETAERILGAEPGELIETQEHFIFNNLLPFGPERKRLTEHINEAMVQTQSIQGVYTFGGNKVNLRLERQPVNGDMPLFGWVSLVELPKKEPTDWRSDVVQWANNHPLLATVAAIVVAISATVIKIIVSG